ncbi:MAG: ROK family transcriptional regulator [Lachnospiraceae bacterium]|nr:ROK family transcriptional regulator [Lachnospiraceae bacterium]MDD3617655.1 ROK family transcriptional regulator [Lachnospiraceae bacterium]
MANTKSNEKKKINKVKIVKYILHQGETSKPEIASKLHISMPTVLQNIKELEDEGIIAQVGEYQSTGGRKAKALSIVGSLKYAVGVDITANHISYVLIDLRGKLIRHERIRHVFENSMDYYEDLVKELNTFIKNTQVEECKILGVGVSLPGIIDKENDMLTRSHLLNLSNVSLKNLKQMIPYEVNFENDANSAAFAEVAGSEENSIYLSLSNSVGGAVYLNHSIYLGDQFKSAEFGHMVIEHHGRTCYCGKKGCADAYCSAKVLAGADGGRLEEFFEKLDRDIERQKNWETYLDYLALLISNLRMAFDCDVILGGYVGGFLQPYMGELNRKIMEYNKFESDTSYVRNCSFEKEAAAIGIAMSFVEGYFENLS